MDSSTVSDRQGSKNRSTAPSSRNRSSQDHTRQVTTNDAALQQRRADKNHEALRRQTQSAFRESIEQDRALQRQNEQAGVEKMVRSVVRKESSQTAEHRTQETPRQADSDAQAQYVREKLNSAYSSTASEPAHEESQQPDPSQRQQQRAIDDYQQSNRNSIDRTVELVI